MRSKNRVATNTIMLYMTLYVNNLKIEISNDMVRSNFESPGGFDTLCDQMKNWESREVHFNSASEKRIWENVRKELIVKYTMGKSGLNEIWS